MIPLNKTEEILNQYYQWKNTVSVELVEIFEEYYNNRSAKWINQNNLVRIQNFLFPTSNYKCAYCECNPRLGNGDLQVDHFYPKKIEEFKNLTFEFENLIPCCPLCNRVKQTNYKHNNIEILNPYNVNNIFEYLTINESLIISEKENSEKGKATISILDNSINSKKFFDDEEKRHYKGGLYLRIQIKKVIEDKIQFLNVQYGHLQNYLTDSNNDISNVRVVESVNILFNMLNNLILDIDEKEPFTATKAYLILNNCIFKECISLFQRIDNEKYKELNDKINEKMKYNIANI